MQSDLTVTIGFVKHGLVTENAGRHMKRLICADIGIRLEREERKLCTRAEWVPDDPKFLLAPPWLSMEILTVT